MTDTPSSSAQEIEQLKKQNAKLSEKLAAVMNYAGAGSDINVHIDQIMDKLKAHSKQSLRTEYNRGVEFAAKYCESMSAQRRQEWNDLSNKETVLANEILSRFSVLLTAAKEIRKYII